MRTPFPTALLLWLSPLLTFALDDPRWQHWSVQPIAPQQAGGSIDKFILEKLGAQGLKLSPTADPRTLIRRLSFDLTGLPPAPEEVEAFVRESAESPLAYDRLVDRLLSSQHYGERWARHWLDIAHYADTHGFERDQLRPHAWRYRDYVIASLNADKPYDQFLREQIAGDVIAPNDPQAVIATGFLAAGPWDFVGQVETQSEMLRRAARAGDLDDMVTQVITSTMGITINCARCHDHKIDPITQEEYYQLWAVFAGVKRDNRQVNPAEAQRQRDTKAQLQKQLTQASAELARLSGDALDLADMVGGGTGRGTGVKGEGIVLETGAVTTNKLEMQLTVRPNTLIPPKFPQAEQIATGLIKGVFLPYRGEVENARILLADAIELRDIPPTSGQSWDAIRNGPLTAQVHAQAKGVDYLSEGHSVLGLHANGGITFDLEAIRHMHGLQTLRFTAALGFGAGEVAANLLGDFAIYLDANRVVDHPRMKKTESFSIDLLIPTTIKFLTLMATDGGDGIGHDLLFLGDARLKPEGISETLSASDQLKREQVKAEIAKLQAALAAVLEPAQVYAVVSQEKSPSVRVQQRGNPEDEAQEVLPAGFAWAKHAAAKFGDTTTPEGQRRRALAEWITHRDNPLTPRVLVNRLWHHHFGQGLVTTPSDFGLGGDKPSHPELLDWLAAEFVKSGWSLKHLHKLMVLSAAYQQQSTSLNEKAHNLDAANRLLWRQNPRRLDAESLHDAVLSVAGTLNPAMGGPGFRDFNYTEAYAPLYDYLTPDQPELWRRSIYRFVVRTTPHQFMSTLDCPDPANFTPVRMNTTTALQALTLSNNEFMLQQAQHLATRIERETNTPAAAIQRAFRLAFQREARDAELHAAMQLVADQGLFALCRMLMNANEFIYLD